VILKIFSPKKSAIKLAFLLKILIVCAITDQNTGFQEKRQFFLKNLRKIAENCDPNVDP
jgi:hypothetical protein